VLLQKVAKFSPEPRSLIQQQAVGASAEGLGKEVVAKGVRWTEIKLLPAQFYAESDLQCGSLPKGHKMELPGPELCRVRAPGTILLLCGTTERPGCHLDSALTGEQLFFFFHTGV
jgi:hypothetical protein